MHSATYRHAAALVAAASLSSSASAAVYVFNGPGATYPALGTGTPYPSTILVAGIPLAEPVVDVDVTITGYSHTFPDDTGTLVTNALNQGVVLHNGHGDGTDVTNLVWVFDDSAAGPLPAEALLTSGTFQPGNIFPADNFGAPAPAGPYGANLAALNTGNPNGTWSLYLEDFVDGDSGSIGAWSLRITTIPEPGSLALVTSLAFAAMWKRRRVI